jgi:hypothetical protein
MPYPPGTRSSTSNRLGSTDDPDGGAENPAVTGVGLRQHLASDKAQHTAAGR